MVVMQVNAAALWRSTYSRIARTDRCLVRPLQRRLRQEPSKHSGGKLFPVRDSGRAWLLLQGRDFGSDYIRIARSKGFTA
jgi:hypothetical protein